MLHHILWGAALVFGTTFVHFGCTVGVLHWVRSTPEEPRATNGVTIHAAALSGVVLLMAFASVIESMLWAGYYTWVGALPDFATAAYFSLVTFTSLGYGDVTLDAQWRILSAFEAANGIIMFGWTTAIIVAVVQKRLRQIPMAKPRS